MERSKKTRLGLLAVAVLATVLYLSISEAGQPPPRLIVIGDSLSASLESWPEELRRLASGTWNIQVMAQNGRTIRDFSIPRDLWTPGNVNETVVYMLGTNDMLQRNDIMHAKYRLRNHLSFLLDRHFNVLLVIPPQLDPRAFSPDATLSDVQAWNRSIKEHRQLFETFRGTHPNLRVYDLEEVWDSVATYDGIHPEVPLSQEIALRLNWCLWMNFMQD